VSIRHLVAAVLLPAVAAGVLPAAPPEVLLADWKDVFAAQPALFQVGVHPVEKPDKAFVATGRLPLEAVSLKTDRDRAIAEKRAELAAKRELLEFVYRRDKGGLMLPPHLERFATEALRFNAHNRTLTVRGLQVAARWTDDKHVWCTVLVSQGNVRRAGEFADQFRVAGAAHYLDLFKKGENPADLYRAFEINPLAEEVRAALAQHFLDRGCRVAAFVVRSPAAQLPGRDDALGKYLAGTQNPAWEKGLKEFQSDRPRLDLALDSFLRALDAQYVNPDALNYVGACYRELGWPRLASTFFEQALAQSEGRVHRYALTNLGLCLADLDEAGGARRHLTKAIEAFPEEGWTAKARQALRRLDAAREP
jgi:tetratricopeptide (TPR) repeat protein